MPKLTVCGQGVACSVHDLSGLNEASAEKLSARHRLDDVHFGGTGVYGIEAEPCTREQVSIFRGFARSLPPVTSPSSPRNERLSCGRQIVFGQAQLHKQ